jgi:hypothetical protein
MDSLSECTSVEIEFAASNAVVFFRNCIHSNHQQQYQSNFRRNMPTKG